MNGDPLPPEPTPATVEAVRQTPWTCRFAYVAAALRSSPTLDGDGVVWTCQPREEGAEPVFTRDTCAGCHLWSLRDGAIATNWACKAAQGTPSTGSRFTRRDYARGAVIVKEGEPADALHTVVSGSAMLVKQNLAGRAVGLDVCTAGSPLGVEWLVTRSASVATVVAVERTVCIATPRSIVLELLSARPSLVRAVIAQSSDQERVLIDRIAASFGCGVEARFAHLFLGLASAVGGSNRGRVVIRLPLLRHDLALLTGTTVETAIRVMSRWEKQHLVTTRPDGFVVHDCRELERVRT